MLEAPAASPVQRPVPFDPERGWRLHPQVAVRPEPFGALLYHFGTRKLSFLKSCTILELVQALGDCDDANAAFTAVGIDADARAPYLSALRVLVESKMLVPKENS